jgi:hypothetical protein
VAQLADKPADGGRGGAGVMARVYSKEGAEGLEALLAIIDAERELLERDAAELEAVGIKAAADIVLEYAADALPERVLRCPYAPEDRCNYESWQRSYENRT